MRLEELVLELTDWCPLRCRHCSSSSGPGCRDSLQHSIAMDLIQQGADLGARQVSFGGGEPTAATDFVKTVKAVVTSGMAAEIFTCGVTRGANGPSPLPGGIIDPLARLDHVKFIFSFHGADAAIHDAITGCQGSFDRTVESLAVCMKAGICCEANFVPLRANAGSFARLLELCAELGVGRMSVLRFVPQGRGEKNCDQLQLSAEEESAFLDELVRLRETSPVAIRTGSPFNGTVPGGCVPCRAGSAKVVVQPDGNVIPCEVYKDAARRDWGLSVYETTLVDCLSSPRFVDLRKTLARTGGACPVHTALRGKRGGEAIHGRPVSAAV